MEFNNCEHVMQLRLSSNIYIVECVGNHFFHYLFQALKLTHFEKTEYKQLGNENKFCPVLDNVLYLRSLDPKDWKHQDHYAVLGLKDLRFNATEVQIKTAYRNMVMKYHPDKRFGEFLPSNDYFSCITKAYEILGEKQNRRSYDSIDPLSCDDSIPSANDTNLKVNFFRVFGKVFKINARWSVKSPVPKLGANNDARDQVDKFYTFWYNFESWREFSYMDEENTEAGQDRETRRWIEKQNKAMRLKKKKEEMTRLRTLVELAYNLDPRIVKFKNEDKAMKLAAKSAKQDAIRERLEKVRKEAKEAEEKIQSAKAEAENAEQERAKTLKNERDAHKKALKKVRKNLRDLCKINNYYTQNEGDMFTHMSSVEKMCEQLDVRELQDLIRKLHADGRHAFLEAVGETDRLIEEERQQSVVTNLTNISTNLHRGNTDISVNNANQWPQDHIQFLVKALKIFPSGTVHRWEAVTDFLNNHCTVDTVGNIIRTPKVVLAKVKELQNVKHSTYEQNEATHIEQAFEQTTGCAIDTVSCVDNPERIDHWSVKEQQLLEEALKTYPASTPERWDKIAAFIPTRSKKACMKRFKEIVVQVKAKKGATPS